MSLAAVLLALSLPASAGITPLSVSSGPINSNFQELALEIQRTNLKNGGVVNQNIKISTSLHVTGDTVLSGTTKIDGALTINGAAVGNQLVQVWAHFVGTGTVVILDSVGVSSVTDLGAGSWRVNFTTPFATNGYAASCTSQRAAGGVRQCFIGNGVSAAVSASDIYVSDEAGTLTDVDQLNVLFVGRR